MNWKEIEIKTTNQAYPAVCNLLNELSVVGISKEKYKSDKDEIIVKGYLDVSIKKTDTIAAKLQKNIFSIQQYNLDVGSGKVKIKSVKNEDWANNWKDNFHPIQLTDRIVIKPTWEEYKSAPDEIVIEIDPGQAFGTGYHATTEGCLKLMEEYIEPEISFLDIGTGTGILSIAAAKLGAGSVDGLDIDPKAVESARANAQLNEVGEIKFLQGDLVDKIDSKYQLVVANILPNIILSLIPDLGTVLADNGLFILSGIIDTKEEEVKEKLKSFDFEVKDRIQDGEWITLAGVRSG